jgi:hypothetical protein
MLSALDSLKSIQYLSSEFEAAAWNIIEEPQFEKYIRIIRRFPETWKLFQVRQKNIMTKTNNGMHSSPNIDILAKHCSTHVHEDKKCAIKQCGNEVRTEAG